MPCGFDDPAAAHAARSATTFTGTASLKLDSDPLGSQFLNDPADAHAIDSRALVLEDTGVARHVRAQLLHERVGRLLVFDLRVDRQHPDVLPARRARDLQPFGQFAPRLGQLQRAQLRHLESFRELGERPAGGRFVLDLQHLQVPCERPVAKQEAGTGRGQDRFFVDEAEPGERGPCWRA